MGKGSSAGLIGRDNEPIRAVTFAGGGFGTALQLGVAHALLVSHGEAPDVVVGISAGSVNAVALAEVLQAGDTAGDPERRLARRIERFRTIFEKYQSAPTELLSALLPDSLQIDTRRPLEPLKLPIHAEREREERDRSLHARSGLMNVYNQLLALGLPIGTIARAARRYLGLKAVGEESDPVWFLSSVIEEFLPFLDMLGANLHRLAPVLPVVLPAALPGEGKRIQGASAGELVFQARAWEWLKRAVGNTLSLAVLAGLWLFITTLSFLALLALVVPFVIMTVVFRLARTGWRKLAIGARLKRRWRGVRGVLEELKRAAGFAKRGPSLWRVRRQRLLRRGRLALRRLGDLSPVRSIVRFLSLNWARKLLGKIPGLEEVLQSYYKRRAQRRERKEALKHKRLEKRRTEQAELRQPCRPAPAEEAAPAEPPREIPDAATAWSAARKWTRLLVTLVWRWALWVVPIAFVVETLSAWAVFWAVSSAFVALGIAAIVLACLRYDTLRLNFLRRNAIDRALFDPHPLRQFLVRLFDPNYYGELLIDDVVENAMANKPKEKDSRRATPPQSLGGYAQGNPPIRVEVAAANVETGEMETLPEKTAVVDALLAGLAVVPIFPSQRIGETYYVDGTNIANEPTRPLLKFLRQRIPRDPARPLAGELNPRSSIVHMYTVSPLPISRPELGRRNGNGSAAETPGAAADSRVHWPLVDVVERALELQRFRDARLERQLTELYTRAMPAGGGLILRAPPAFEGDLGKDYLRTWVYPIEPQRPVTVNNRVLRAPTEDDRRRIIAETVADGCRAALEAMIQRDIQRGGRRRVSCRQAIEGRLAGQRSVTLPGSDARSGPGLVEVCRHCALARAEDGAAGKNQRCRLVVKPQDQTPPPWPLEGKRSFGSHDKRLEPPTNQQKAEALRILESYKLSGYKTGEMRERTPWPRMPTRPTVSLLFSGGVFRGVYQLGVLNALSEVGLHPDIVAGASVGSITAAMAARVFATIDDNPERQRELRSERIRRLAATYMAIDRLVLTDRFSDFVRTMTVRAAQTRFSLRQADQVVRRYDQAPSGEYERKARIVLAGLERLLYISPFEFRDLLEALRLRRSDRALAMIKDFFQELLDRGGVGQEVLGSEPLELLIVEHVLEKAGMTEAEIKSTPFEHFLKDGIFLLATATNLTRGRLEILGEHQLGARKQRTSLIQGLLASSAFPGVFRPRWSWEVMPHAANEDLFTDGGVMDNLPLDAVARFLAVAAEAKLVRARPGRPGRSVPHLLFSASLQADPPRLSPDEVAEITCDWPALRDRTKRLSYNQKLEIYERAQQAVRRIWEVSEQAAPGSFLPVDLEVLTVRPRWLCGTFAFHPMLGFRRKQQARSIAHGCASTLVRLDGYRRIPTRERWAGREGWGIDLDRLPEVDRLKGRSTFDPVRPADGATEGRCWFRPEIPCPFSRYSQGQSTAEDSHTRFELDRIHQECGLPETHARRD